MAVENKIFIFKVKKRGNFLSPYTQTPPEMKLPALYLIDSIVKNLGKQCEGRYVELFSRLIVNIFCDMFQEVGHDLHSLLYTFRNNSRIL